MKQLESALSSIGESLCDLDGIFLTHEHSDHTKALPVLCKHKEIPVYCQRAVAKEMYLSLLGKNLSREAAALAKNIRTVDVGMEYEVGDLLITPFQTPHDSVDSQGFVIGDRLLGIATDLGHVSDEVSRYLSGCQSVILESNHDLTMLREGPYPPYLKERVASEKGHLNNADCASFAQKLLDSGCRDFTLFHLSRENNTPALALSQTREALQDRNAKEGADFSLRAADMGRVVKIL